MRRFFEEGEPWRNDNDLSSFFFFFFLLSSAKRGVPREAVQSTVLKFK